MIKLLNLLKDSLKEGKYGSYDDGYPSYDDEYPKNITPETIKKINSNDRIILGTKDNIDLSIKVPPSEMAMKPKGLWYGFGTSWIDFVRSEMPAWESDTKHVFKIEIDTSNILIIKDDESFLEFSDKYKDPEYEKKWPDIKIDKINWPEVAKEYKGIEFPVYFSKYRMNRKYFWYYPWDVASGCIWDLSAVKKVIKLQ
jgi:hypothetical protein